MCCLENPKIQPIMPKNILGHWIAFPFPTSIISTLKHMQRDRWKRMTSTCHHCHVISHHVASTRVWDRTIFFFVGQEYQMEHPIGIPMIYFVPNMKSTSISSMPRQLLNAFLNGLCQKMRSFMGASCEFLWRIDKNITGFCFTNKDNGLDETCSQFWLFLDLFYIFGSFAFNQIQHPRIFAFKRLDLT